jgi:hypothetical protein
VHAFPSLHAEPLVLFGFEQMPLATLQVPMSWHWSEALHTTGLLPWHTPTWHVSDCVQAFPSLHVAPSALLGFEHVPLLTSQVPAAWHWSDAEQTTGFAPVQVPAWHVSVCVQAFPSLQVAPSALLGFEHVPLLTSQVPAAWHWSEAEQTTGLLPWHTPTWHVSDCVHAFPSLQTLPLLLFGFEQTPVAELQTPASWHWSEAEHTTPAHKSGAKLFNEKVAPVTTPVTFAVTEKAPTVPLALMVVATRPDASVTPDAEPRVPLAPVPGTVKVTVAPLTGLPLASVTLATRAVA